MNKQVFYLMTAPNHCPYLVVCLRTLRNFYQGPVTIYAWDDSYRTVCRIAEDKNLGPTRVVPRSPSYKGKNAQELDKMLISRDLQAGTAYIYLDADLIITNPIDELFDLASERHFVCTQFCSWRMSKQVASNRVRKLYDNPDICPNYINAALWPHLPSLNSGIYAHVCTPHTRDVFNTWHKWTWGSKSIYIAGETSLHALVQRYKLHVLEGGKYNCSHKYQPADLEDVDVAIWHGHGDSFTRPSKSPRAFDHWWSLFRHCFHNNVGFMQEWIDRIPNRFLKECIAKYEISMEGLVL